MAILETKILLYLLIFLGCFVSTAQADDNQFFDSKVDYFGNESKQACSTCQVQENMNKTVANIIAKTQTQLAQLGAASIILFLDPSCQFSQLAISNLVAFNQNHPTVAVKIYVNGPIGEFLGIGRDLMQQHPSWSVINDLAGGNAQNLGISKAPAYIFSLQGRMYRIYGTPDLEETWGKINATAK
jgi:hypothetical protein